MNLFIEEEGSVTLPFNVEETAGSLWRRRSSWNSAPMRRK